MKKNKLFGRFTTIGMTAAILATCTPVNVLAAEETTPTVGVIENQDVVLPDASSSGTGSTVVEYNSVSDQTFTVTIPKKIVLGSDKRATYNVIVKGDVALGSTVDVAPHDDFVDITGVNFEMSVQSGKVGNPVDVEVTQEDTSWDYAAITAVDEDDTIVGTAKDGSIYGSKLTKGVWSGNLTFDINFNDEYAEGNVAPDTTVD